MKSSASICVFWSSPKGKERLYWIWAGNRQECRWGRGHLKLPKKKNQANILEHPENQMKSSPSTSSWPPCARYDVKAMILTGWRSVRSHVMWFYSWNNVLLNNIRNNNCVCITCWNTGLEKGLRRWGDQAFQGPKVTPSKNGKVTGFSPLFFENGPIQQNKIYFRSM